MLERVETVSYTHLDVYKRQELKYSLTRQIWNKFTSTIKEPQMQGILQGLRVVGSGSKLGREYPVRAFRLGGPVELVRLRDYIPDSNGEQQRLEGLMRKSRLSLAEAKEDRKSTRLNSSHSRASRMPSSA